jgi:hypothetical protein
MQSGERVFTHPKAGKPTTMKTGNIGKREPDHRGAGVERPRKVIGGLDVLDLQGHAKRTRRVAQRCHL